MYRFRYMCEGRVMVSVISTITIPIWMMCVIVFVIAVFHNLLDEYVKSVDFRTTCLSDIPLVLL